MDNLIVQFPANTSDGAARRTALAAIAAVKRRPAAVVDFSSQGTLLIIGEPARALASVERLGDTLDCTVLAPAGDNVPVTFTSNQGTPRITGQPATLAGHLGNFELSLAGPNGHVDTKTATGGWRDHFDLVLDLSDDPLNTSAIHPLGYYAPGQDENALDESLDALRGLVGEFEKPKYFTLDTSICAHSRSGITACTRCIDVCPTDAIASAGEQVAVDPNLCQGAGSCATACPTGAIQYNYPSLGDSLQAVRSALQSYHAAGGSRPALLFYGADREASIIDRLAGQLPQHIIPVEVEETASVGMDIWLAALAYGAARVYLLMAPDSPPSEIREVSSQLAFAGAILDGMGHSSRAVTLVSEADDTAVRAAFAESETALIEKFAQFAPLDEKRRTIRFAVDHLFSAAPKPRPLTTMPAGAPFGDVQVDSTRCTLCMACVSQCPARALEAGEDVPQLRFIEDNCVQCGMCCKTCPEDAISISPRYLFDGEQRCQRRIVNEDAPFHCISCGKIFGSRRVIAEMSRKLQTHPMFQGVAIERLKMCEECRVKDMFEDQVSNEDAN